MGTFWTDLPNSITAIATLIAAIGALIVTVRNGTKANDAKIAAATSAAAAEAAKVAALDATKRIVQTQDGVFELGKRVDGRLSELLELTKKAAMAEGRLEGKADEKAARGIPTVPVEIVSRAESLAPLRVEQVTSEPPVPSDQPPATDKGRE